MPNRSFCAYFTSLNLDYIHPPNGREGNVMENGVGRNPVGADSKRLAEKIARNKPGQKMVSEKKGATFEGFQDVRDPSQ